MKKAYSILTAVLLMVCCCLGLTACGGDTSSSVTLTTQYTVNFDSQGGTTVESQRILSGNPVRHPETPQKEGSFLLGWYKDVSLENEWDFDVDRVYSDMTLYAGWHDGNINEPTASLVYILENGSYTVTDVGEETLIVIPSQYNGLPVTKIQGEYGTGAFARSDVSYAVIPDSVTEIGQNSFNNCSNLTTIVIGENSNLTTIGNNAFSGCGSLESFYLPSKAVTLGNSVFNNCGSIKEFTVAESNSVYKAENGHLIEKNTNILVRGANNEVVPSGVTEIASAAFRRSMIESLFIPKTVTVIGNYIIADSAVTEINYEGTEEEWNMIEKNSDMWNFGKRDVPLSYSQSEPNNIRVLIAFFSRADENYGVGVIEKGNTHIIAEMISELTNGELFHIQRDTPYPISYSETTSEAQREKNANARPSLLENIDISDYDIVFLGYPNWWGDMPMPVYTFIESHSWQGKTVIPFATHAGSGLSGTVSTLRNKLTGATVLNGFAITGTTAQNNRTEARQSVTAWINGLDIKF